ncbi:MAG: sugar nucleotide-binding protein, partial [bacterium]|nr:sugar nucleotide-binding protein [bacterium]
PSSAYPTKAKRPFYSVLSKEKIKRDFKITIPYWKESLVKCLKLF